MSKKLSDIKEAMLNSLSKKQIKGIVNMPSKPNAEREEATKNKLAKATLPGTKLKEETLSEVTYGAPVDRKSSLKGTTPSAPHNETPEAKAHREKGEREAKRKLHYHKHGEWPEEHHESVDLDEEVDLFLDEETGEHYYMEFNEEELKESAPKGRRIVTRVNFKGQRKKVLKCGPGKMIKHVNGNRACVVQSGTYKRKKKLAVRKANRTKKRKGAGYTRKINIKRQRALKRRHSMGL